jgi:hypothetical protein
VPEGYSWHIEAHIALGNLRHGWSQSADEFVGGVLSVTLAPPPEAFLHELAAAYVTDLVVDLIGVDADGHTLLLRAPPAFLAYPEGREGGAVVWDRSAMDANAPLGITDETERARFASLPYAARVMPPLRAAAPAVETGGVGVVE